MNERKDEALAERVLAGDREAFNEYARLLRPKLKGVLKQRAAPRLEVDLTQEELSSVAQATFLQFFRRINGGKNDIRDADKYLFYTAFLKLREKVRNDGRKLLTRKTKRIEEADLDRVEGRNHSAAEPFGIGDIEQILSALQSLPKKDRLLLEQWLASGGDWDKVVEELQKPRSTLKQQFRRAVRKMREKTRLEN